MKIQYSDRADTHTSLNSSREAAGVKTSSSPITWITEKNCTSDLSGSRLCCLNRSNNLSSDDWWLSNSCMSYLGAGLDIWHLFAPLHRCVCMCFWGTYILMFHVFEESQFSVRSSAVDEGLERPGELFDGHFLTKAHIICWAKEGNTETFGIFWSNSKLKFLLTLTLQTFAMITGLVCSCSIWPSVQNGITSSQQWTISNTVWMKSLRSGGSHLIWVQDSGVIIKYIKGIFDSPFRGSRVISVEFQKAN